MRSAVWSDTGSASGSMWVDVPALVLPVLDMGEQVSSIEVTMPPGPSAGVYSPRCSIGAG